MQKTMTDGDYADDLALRASKPAKVKILLICLKQAAGGVDFYVNSNETKFMCFNQDGSVS